MRTLKLHVPDAALPPWDPFVQQTKEARVFRRAQAVRAVVQGQRLPTVSDTLQLTYSALRQWVQRWAHPDTQGLIARARWSTAPRDLCTRNAPQYQLYQRTRQVLMAHQERPIYAFHW